MAAEISLVGYLKKHVHQSLVEGPYGSFVPLSAVQQYYENRHRLPDLLKAFQSTTVNERAIRERYLRVFTILSLIEEASHIRHFLQHEHLEDVHLPFRSSDGWPRECQRFFDRFREEQWKFCPLDFCKQALNNRHLIKSVVLPITKKDLVRKGVHSQVWLVELHPEYDHLADGASHRPVPQKYIMKTCESREEQSYVKESEAYTLLQHYDDIRGDEKNNQVAQHLVRLYGSWRIDGKFNLLLEYADKGPLETFFQKVKPPQTAQDFFKFWNSLVQIVKPVGRIHELSGRGTIPSVFQGIHQDITPANILLSSGEGLSDYDIICKLADFGLTTFVEKPKAGEYIESEHGRGTQMYNDPFLQRSVLSAKPDIDIWALACIFSEALAWSLKGPAGVEEYLADRKKETSSNLLLVNAGYDGCFHDGKSVLKAVIQTHTDLRRLPCPINSIVNDMTTLIEDMLTDSGSRLKAVTIYKKCRMMMSRADPDQDRSGLARSPHGVDAEKPYPAIFQTEKEKPRRRPPQIPPGYVVEDTETAMGLGIVQELTHPPNPPPIAAVDEKIPCSEVGPLLKHNSRDHNLAACTSRDDEESTSRLQSKPPGTDNSRHDDKNSNLPLKRKRNTPVESIAPCERGKSPLPTARHIGSEKTKKTEPHREIKKPHVTINQGCEWLRRVKGTKGRNPKTQISVTPLIGDDCLSKLYRRDQIFLFDNSESMKPHWPQVLHVFDVLAYIVKHEDPDKMEIYFTNSKNHARGKNRHDFYNMLDNINTTGKCNMKLSLDRIVESWLAEYEKSKKDSKRRAIASMFHSHKPKNGVNIYVLTDGIWQTKPHSLGGVDEMIKKVVKRLNDKAMAADYIGIQFIRFGNDKYGIERLEKLDRDLGRRGVNEDIVDTEPCDGNVLKMLLGSFNSYWDDDDNSLRSTPLTGSPSTVRSS